MMYSCTVGREHLKVTNSCKKLRVALSLMMYDISWEVGWKVFIFETCTVGKEHSKASNSCKKLRVLVQRNYLQGLKNTVYVFIFNISWLAIFFGVWTLY